MTAGTFPRRNRHLGPAAADGGRGTCISPISPPYLPCIPLVSAQAWTTSRHIYLRDSLPAAKCAVGGAADDDDLAAALGSCLTSANPGYAPPLLNGRTATNAGYAPPLLRAAL